MTSEALLTHGTALVSFLAYGITLALRGTASGRPDRQRWSRAFWTASVVVFILHVLCAFHFVHHWSHAAAYAATARQSAEVMGLNWGGGLFWNYAFTLVWIADAVWWWLARQTYEARPRSIEWLVQGFMGFMWFNATVVFGHGWVRWAGAVAFVLLGSFALKARTK